MYDCLVIGAGISGLYATREILKKHPEWSVGLAELYKGLGGRTYSYKYKDMTWEMGAGRIHKNHKMLVKLIKEYELTLIPIGDSICYKENENPVEENQFEELSHIYLEPLTYLSPMILANNTIVSLLNKLYGHIKTRIIASYFPYRAEINTLRADLALKTFFGGEMSSHKNYGVIKEGFSELVKRMVDDIKERGGKILVHHKLTNFTNSSCTFEVEGEKQEIETKNIILALHKDAVAKLPPFYSWNTLRHLKTRPLLRIYAVFNKPWFSDLKRIVTPGPLRYIIPINSKLIMISYTDADDTSEYMRILYKEGEEKLQKVVMEDVRTLFPDRNIPEPTFFKPHPWDTGATYWLPGNYSPETLSLEAVHPLSKYPNVWLCGESWSLRQAWVEGALEHTSLCLKNSRLG
jgi:protoporphyrinogen oxidase